MSLAFVRSDQVRKETVRREHRFALFDQCGAFILALERALDATPLARQACQRQREYRRNATWQKGEAQDRRSDRHLQGTRPAKRGSVGGRLRRTEIERVRPKSITRPTKTAFPISPRPLHRLSPFRPL